MHAFERELRKDQERSAEERATEQAKRTAVLQRKVQASVSWGGAAQGGLELLALEPSPTSLFAKRQLAT